MSEPEELPIIQILNFYCQNIFDKNLEGYLSLYADDAKIFDLWGPEWCFETDPDWRVSAKNWFKSLKKERIQVDFEELQVEQGFQMGFLSGFVKYTALSEAGKELRSIENRFTCIIEPRDNAWKITHQHTSVPIDGDEMKAILKR